LTLHGNNKASVDFLKPSWEASTILYFIILILSNSKKPSNSTAGNSLYFVMVYILPNIVSEYLELTRNS